MKVKPKKKPTKTKQFIFTCPHCKKNFDNSSSLSAHVRLHTTEYPYECELCDYKCKVKKYLTRHVKKAHTKPTGHQCKVCGKCFHFDCKLRDHMRVHTGEKPYKCDVCDKAFSSSYSYKGHMLIHTGEKPFQCSYCEYACRDNSTIRRHMERHMGISKDYPCSICNKNFKHKETLRIHVDEVHFELDTRKFPCEKCDKVFKTKGTRKIHMNTVHSKTHRIKCEICGSLYSSTNIHSHMRRHVDVTPYKCSYCKHSFTDKWDLKRHSLIHFPERQFQCHICHRRFPRKPRLTKHLLLHEDEKYNKQCDYCGDIFLKKVNLSRHIKKAHGPKIKSKKYICDICSFVCYAKKWMILHLKYGHGTENDSKCQMCEKDYDTFPALKEHYFKQHKIKYCLLPKKHEHEVPIKEEPFEEYEEFKETAEPLEFMYEVQVEKQEIDASFDQPQDPILPPTSPENFETDSDHITYSKKVLSEDISRSLIEKEHNPEELDDFFIGRVMKKPVEIKIELPKQIVDENKEKLVVKCLEKLLTKVRLRKGRKALEKLRRKYNRRIKMATSIGSKKEQKQSIRYFKKPKEVDNSQKKSNNDKEIQKEHDTTNVDDKIGDQRIDNDDKKDDHHTYDNDINDPDTTDNTEKVHVKNTSDINKIDAQDKNKINDEEIHGEVNSKEITNDDVLNDPENGDDKMNDPTGDKIDDPNDDNDNIDDPNDEKDSDYKDSDFESNSGGENNHGKVKFNTHQCYICFKLFKTKTDLKRHCKEHFDLCNEKMLKKCPFCGYVTNLHINRHIKLVHKVDLNIKFSRIKERDTQNGSKYVVEIDKNCDLEIIPSISNLNKIASMKIDEKNRDKKNEFLGTTKLVRKGNNWMVEKKAVSISNDYLLPEFSEEDYLGLKYTGHTYVEQLKSLSIIAKNKGLKILYPCEGCDKICLTLSALKLHNRKHEINPKKFRPKVWKNKILNGYSENSSQNRKKTRKYSSVNNKYKKIYGDENKTSVNDKNGKNKTYSVKPKGRLEVVNKNGGIVTKKVANRFADPNPVKNKHKCDKELIEFYENNIKGGDIEFWQFLKIFNKMGRENVNDFKDLESRYDFGFHNTINSDQTNNINETNNTIQTNEEAVKQNDRVIRKKTGQSKKKAFTRAIMISKKEYLKRIEMKNEMRKRLEETKS